LEAVNKKAEENHDEMIISAYLRVPVVSEVDLSLPPCFRLSLTVFDLLNCLILEEIQKADTLDWSCHHFLLQGKDSQEEGLI
jgi:hypothetical protein